MLKYHESEGIIDSFSKNHSTPYSAVALQEMNLYHFYPSVYWNCATLTVEASALDENEEDELLEEETNQVEEESELIQNLTEKPKQRNNSTDYGKIAKAIGNLQATGMKMELPDINKADLEFNPDVENNSIIFGLKGISGVNDDLAKKIINNRPFVNVEDFYERVNPTNVQMFSLIKAGCFDDLVKISRVNIMKQFLFFLAKKEFPFKDKLNMTDFNKLALANKLPEELRREKQMFFFREWINMQPNGTSSDNIFIKNEEEQAIKFYKNRCITEYNPRARTTPFLETEDGYVVYKRPFKTMYEAYMKNNVTEWLELQETKEYYNNFLQETFVEEQWNKNCEGTISAWEMESLSYYYNQHELANVDRTRYKIDSFNSLPEEPIILDYNTGKNGREYPNYQAQRIMGTVLDRNKNTNNLTLLTPEGVVVVKFYDNLFNFYNREIKRPENRKGKIVNATIEKSWLTRGNKLIINGIRRGDTFFPKRFFNTDFLGKHTVVLIENVDYNGNMNLKLEREKV